MPKVKTRKAAKKRFKKSGSGKIMRHKAGKAHLQTKKPSDRKRRLSKKEEIDKSDKKRVRRMLKS